MFSLHLIAVVLVPKKLIFESKVTGAEWSRHSQLAWFGQTCWGDA